MSFPTARCPPGTSVLGVGFYNSIADVDFAKAYDTFVGASFFNETNVTATGLHVQAICAAVATTAGVRNAPSVAAVEQQFSADVAAATARH